MTTQHSTVPRRLRRRSDERVLAGVASGLGDYFNVDPILIRVLLVASLVFGGLGIFLYVAAWLLVPDDASDTSIAERALGRAGLGGGLVGGVIAIIGVLILLGIGAAILDETGPNGGAFLLALVILGVGALLLRSRREDGPIAPAAAGTEETQGRSLVAARPVVRRERRPGSPLGWYALGAALVGVGLLALGSTTWDLALEPAHYVGLVFGALAVALLVGAFWGHARFLIVIGLLLLPFAWTASLVDVPIQGSWGSVRHEPATAAGIRDEYRVAGGQLLLDLTGVTDAEEPITIHASVAFGEMRVQVPADATVQVEASVGGGVMRLLDAPLQDGTRLVDSQVVGAGAPDFILDLDAGLGAIRVDAIERTDNR